jgi:hypothetical protein
VKISKVDYIVGVTGEWHESEDGTHVVLPLDPAQFDAAGLEAAKAAVLDAYHRQTVSEYLQHPNDATAIARAALAAYARTVAGGGNA